ncbi:hypothetical protein pipiens_011901 [Culex pipiens pipiens]|uniref:Uncharacterized protein n=1 Tax=Culex pipiens pipiens TaxID=38569 RepID=A0ABD1D4F0_CULPP
MARMLLISPLAVVAADSGNVATTSPAPANATTTTVPQNVTETTTSVSTTSAVVSSTVSVNATTSPAETTTSAGTTTTVAPMSTTTSRPVDSTWFVNGYLCKLTLLKEINIRYTVCSDKKSNDTSVASGQSGN